MAIIFTASCSNGDTGGGGGFPNDGGSPGKGGSMARFCIIDSTLFTVDYASLNMVDISKPDYPVHIKERTQNLDFGIETIFPMDSLLFIGSQDGIYIFYFSKHGFLRPLSSVWHLRSCDPVVAQDNYAYVTLNSNNIACGPTSNLLQIYDISDIKNPELKETIRLNSPMGLGIDGDKLFVCDNGLKVYDISNRIAPEQIDDLYNVGVDNVTDAYDVIPYKDKDKRVLILVASSGIYQFDYSGELLKLLSKIEVKKQ
jgi:hypothetical protein